MDKQETSQEKAERVGKNIKQFGNGMVGCGCLLTIFITIPIILIVIFML